MSLGDVKEAVPTRIDGGDATTLETYFAPWPIDCKGVTGSNCNPTANFMTWGTFLKSIKSGDVLKFNLIADIYGKNPQTANCTVAINDALIAQLNAPAKWSAPACEEALSSL